MRLRELSHEVSQGILLALVGCLKPQLVLVHSFPLAGEISTQLDGQILPKNLGGLMLGFLRCSRKLYNTNGRELIAGADGGDHHVHVNTKTGEVSGIGHGTDTCNGSLACGFLRIDDVHDILVSVSIFDEGLILLG
jgi:hypothetical protein